MIAHRLALAVLVLAASCGVTPYALAQAPEIPPPTDVWFPAEYCASRVANPSAIAGANKFLADNAGKSVRLPPGCKVPVGAPASGSYGLIVKSKTRILCDNPATDGFVAVAPQCTAGTALGAACTTIGANTGQCGTGGVCGYASYQGRAVTGASAAFSASGQSFGIIGFAAGSVTAEISGCGFWLNQVDTLQRCASGHGTDAGKACEFRCSGNALLSCDQDADCSGGGYGTCTNVTGFCAPTGDTGYCSDPPGRGNLGKITAVDGSNVGTLTLDNVRVYDAIDATDAFIVAAGSGDVRLDRVNTTLLSRPVVCDSAAACTEARPLNLSDSDNCWLAGLAGVTPVAPAGVKSSTTGFTEMSRVTTKGATNAALVTAGSGAAVDRCVLSTTSASSVVVSLAASNGTVSRSTITQPGQSSTKGIYGGASNLTVDNVSITGGGAGSIAIDGPNNGVIVQKARITLPSNVNGAWGIKLAGAGNAVMATSIAHSGTGTGNVAVADYNPFSGSAFNSLLITMGNGRGNVGIYAYGTQSSFTQIDQSGGFVSFFSVLGNVTLADSRLRFTIGPKVVLQGGGPTEFNNYRAWNTGLSGEGWCSSGSGLGNYCNTADAGSTCSGGTCRPWANVHIGWPRVNSDALLGLGNSTAHATSSGGINHAGDGAGNKTGDGVRIEDVGRRCTGSGSGPDSYTYCTGATDCACGDSDDCGACVNSADCGLCSTDAHCGGGVGSCNTGTGVCTTGSMCNAGVCRTGTSMCSAGACRSSTLACATTASHSDILIQGQRFLAGQRVVDAGPITSSSVSTISGLTIKDNAIDGAAYDSGVTVPDASKVSTRYAIVNNDFDYVPTPISSGFDWTKATAQGNVNVPVSAESVGVRSCTNRTTSIARGEAVVIASGNDDSCVRATGYATHGVGVALGAFGNPSTMLIATSGVTDCSVISGAGVVAGDVLKLSWTSGSDVGKFTKRLTKVEPGFATARAAQSGNTVRCEVGLVPPAAPQMLGQRLVVSDDFLNVTTASAITNGGAVGDASIGMTCVANSTGASCDGVVDTNAVDTSLVSVDTGSTSTGRAAVMLSVGSTNTLDRLIRFGTGEVYFRARVGVTNAMTGSGETICVATGLMDDVTGATLAATDGVYLKACDGTNSQHWQLITCSNSTCTATNTSVAVSSNANSPGQVVELFVNAAGTSAEAWINGAKAASATTNIPTGVGSGGAARQTTIVPIAIRKQASTTVRGALVDYYFVSQEYDPQR